MVATPPENTEQRIERLVSAADRDAVDRLLQEEPALLDLAPEILSSARAGSAESRAAAVERVAHFNALLLGDPRSYPLGHGPIERLWVRCHTGEIKLATAQAIVAEPDFMRVLHPLYLRRLAIECLKWADQGRSQQALEMHALVRAAQVRLPGLEHAPQSIRADLARYEIDLASTLLVRIPDAALYRSAIDAGDALVALARATGAVDVEGEALHSMGLLIVNAYLQFSNDASYRTQIDRWRGSIEATAESGEQMPSADDALALGIDYLRQASALRSGAARGASLSLLAPMLVWQATLRVPPTRDGEAAPRAPRNEEAVQVAREALTLLDEPASLHRRVHLLELLKKQGEAIGLSDLQRFLDLDVDALDARLGVFAQSVLASLVDLVAPLDLERALQVTEQAQGLSEHRPNESSLLDLYRMQARLLHLRMQNDPAWSAFVARGGDRTRDVAAQLKQLAAERAWSHDVLANAFVALAYRAVQSDEPSAALPLVQEARRISPAFFARFQAALTTFEADIWGTIARVLSRRAEWPDAIAAMAAALDGYLRVNMKSKARALLEAMKDCIGRTTNPIEVVHAVARSALELELEVGDAASAELQEIVRRSLAGTEGRTLSVDDYLTALHVAKGQRFAAALSSPRTPREPDRALAELLARVEQAEGEVGSEAVVEPEVNERDLDPRSLAAFVDGLSFWGRTELVPAPPESGQAANEPSQASPDAPDLQAFMRDVGIAYARRFTLTAQAAEGEQEAGATAVERLTNLQRRFDRASEARLVRSPDAQPAPLTAPELRELLDERTVLLDLYLGRSNAEPVSVGVYSLIGTQDGFEMHVEKTRFSEGWMTLAARGPGLRATAMALQVERVRMGVMRATAGRRVVDRDAEAQLEGDLVDYLGDAVETLHALRAQGKDHLCIVPHGPLHYYPLHLLGPVGRALADEWVVTYLPSLHLLRRAAATAQNSRRTQICAALGLGFANRQPHGLTPLPSSIEELDAVSGVFGVQPLRDQAATEAAFLDALARYRYVHLSTHGRHNADAPSFQVVYLSPEPSSDGCLYVHELTDVDMRGLEVLSLSACETALGRFDAGDNLRGLPARCFLSGAQTIITTLWEANAEASKEFFATFYERLHAGESKLDAFASAQRHTRKLYPKYADWGAFCFMGDWLQSTRS